MLLVALKESQNTCSDFQDSIFLYHGYTTPSDVKYDVMTKVYSEGEIVIETILNPLYVPLQRIEDLRGESPPPPHTHPSPNFRLKI